MDCSSPHPQAPLSMKLSRQEEWGSRGSSQPRDWTGMSCIAGRFLPCASPGKLVLPLKMFGIKALVWEISSTSCTLKEIFIKGFQVLPVFQWSSGNFKCTAFCCPLVLLKMGLGKTTFFPALTLLPVSASRGHWRGKTEVGGASSCCARFSRLGQEGTSPWQPQRVATSAFFRHFPEASLLEVHPPSEAPSQTPGPSSSRIAALSAPQVSTHYTRLESSWNICQIAFQTHYCDLHSHWLHVKMLLESPLPCMC